MTEGKVLKKRGSHVEFDEPIVPKSNAVLLISESTQDFRAGSQELAFVPEKTNSGCGLIHCNSFELGLKLITQILQAGKISLSKVIVVIPAGMDPDFVLQTLSWVDKEINKAAGPPEAQKEIWVFLNDKDLLKQIRHEQIIKPWHKLGKKQLPS